MPTPDDAFKLVVCNKINAIFTATGISDFNEGEENRGKKILEKTYLRETLRERVSEQNLEVASHAFTKTACRISFQTPHVPVWCPVDIRSFTALSCI